MAAWALFLYLFFAFLAFGVRVLIQLQRTGSTGLKGLSGAPGSVEWWGGACFVLAIVLGFAAPLLSLFGIHGPLAALDRPAVHVLGFLLYGTGLVALFGAQLYMGRSWRIGVDEREVTELMTGGPFALVRNPIYSALLPTALGIGLLVPSPLALGSLAILFVGLEIQTRLVEEPYLLRVHGARYRAYALRVGRFFPGLGRLA